jgi:Tfp pilus assembly protein PilN
VGNFLSFVILILVAWAMTATYSAVTLAAKVKEREEDNEALEEHCAQLERENRTLDLQRYKNRC